MPLATGEDLIAFYDARLVGELASDDGDAVDVDDIPAHEVIVKALSAASGEFTTALRVGGRYTVAQLEALTADDQELMKAIICSLAMARLFRRRPSHIARTMSKHSPKMAARPSSRSRTATTYSDYQNRLAHR